MWVGWTEPWLNRIIKPDPKVLQPTLVMPPMLLLIVLLPLLTLPTSVGLMDLRRSPHHQGPTNGSSGVPSGGECDTYRSKIHKLQDDVRNMRHVCTYSRSRSRSFALRIAALQRENLMLKAHFNDTRHKVGLIANSTSTVYQAAATSNPKPADPADQRPKYAAALSSLNAASECELARSSGWIHHASNLSASYHPYPLTASMLNRTMIVTEDAARMWRRTVRKMWSGEEVVVVVLGNSETSGVGCRDAQYTGKECAWPARVGRTLNARFPRANVKVVNAARGGTQTRGMIPALSGILKSIETSYGRPPDVVVLDFAVSDATEDANTDMIQAATEVTIRRIRQEYPEATLMFFQTTCRPYKQISTNDVTLSPGQQATRALCFEVSNIYTKVALQYDVPVVNYRAGVWPEVSEPLERLFFNHWIHPGSDVHQLMADVFVHAWFNVLLDELQCDSSTLSYYPKPPVRALPMSDAQLVAEYDVCRHPLTVHSAYDMPSAAKSSLYAGVEMSEHINGGWSLYEDVHGKPGWISTGPRGSNISFPIQIGADPRIVVMILKSYKGMGKAKMYFKQKPDISMEIDASWKDTFSLSVPLVITPSSGIQNQPQFGESGAGLMPALAPNSKVDLVFETSGCSTATSCGKFKLITIQSC